MLTAILWIGGACVGLYLGAVLVYAAKEGWRAASRGFAPMPFLRTETEQGQTLGRFGEDPCAGCGRGSTHYVVRLVEAQPKAISILAKAWCDKCSPNAVHPPKKLTLVERFRQRKAELATKRKIEECRGTPAV